MALGIRATDVQTTFTLQAAADCAGGSDHIAFIFLGRTRWLFLASAALVLEPGPFCIFCAARFILAVVERPCRLARMARLNHGWVGRRGGH